MTVAGPYNQGMPTAPGREFGPLALAVSCALFVVAGTILFHEQMGTHSWPIYAVTVLAAGACCLVPQSTKGVLRKLGLGRPQGLKWLLVLFGAGVLSGVLRWVLYRWAGLGGVKFYEQEFVPLFHRDSLADLLLTSTVFLGALYLAVLIPSVLFLSVIQEPFSRANWFPIGLLLQALVFGWLHCFMTRSFDALYGGEAFCGGIVAGIAYQYVKNVWVPAVFVSSSVFVSTLLLILVPT
jgi:membrane protease YdiL (CAAX protease family)